MRSTPQWIIVKYIYRSADDKTDKLPIDHRSLSMFPKDSGWQQDPAAWTSYESAQTIAALAGPDYGVGFLFTSTDPFFFLDIDDCLTVPGSVPNETATAMVGRFQGAAVEVSHSGRGLHIFGTYTVPEPVRGCRGAGGLELYTSGGTI